MTLDAGNVRMAFNSLVEKSEARERERQREEARRLKRLENGFKEMLRAARDPPVDGQSSWEAVRARFCADPAFLAIPLESERMRVYKDFLVSLDEMCLHRHGKRKKKEKKKKRKRNRSSSASDAAVPPEEGGDSLMDEQRSRSSAKRARSGQSSGEGSRSGSPVEKKKKHKKTKKKKKRKTESRREHSEGEISDREVQPGARRRRTSFESDLSEGQLQEQRRKLLEELDD